MKCVTDTTKAIKILEDLIDACTVHTDDEYPQVDALEEIEQLASDPHGRRDYLLNLRADAIAALSDLRPVQPNV